MKKLFAILLIATLSIMIMSACSGAEKAVAGDSVNTTISDEENAQSAEQSDPSGSTFTDPKVTFDVPEGWQEIEGAALAQYMKELSSFIVSYDIIPDAVKSPDDYVEFAKKEFTSVFADASFSDAEKITINGIEGRDFTFTTSAPGVEMKYRIVYLFKDSLAYTMTCASFAEEFDTAAPDYESMINSLQLK